MKKLKKDVLRIFETDYVQNVAVRSSTMPHSNRQRTQVKQNAIYQMRHAHSHRYEFSVTLESTLEWDYFNWRHFEFDFPEFEMQPDRIYYHGKLGPRTPYGADGRYIDHNGEEHLDEVKYVCDANLEKNQIKHRLIESHCADIGVHFSVVTEETIHSGERASNLSYLHPCWAHPSPVDEFSRLYDKVAFKEADMHTWITASKKHGFLPCLIRRAIAYKLLKCDITQSWSDLYLSV